MMNRRTTIKALLVGLAGLFGLGAGADAGDPSWPDDAGDEFWAERLPNGAWAFHGRGVCRTPAEAAARLPAVRPGRVRQAWGVCRTPAVRPGIRQAWGVLQTPTGYTWTFTDIECV